jgi:hypothetical protein
MKRLLGLFSILAALAGPAMAQDVPKIDLSAGYSFRLFNPTSGAYRGMNGWYLSGNYNIFKRWLGAEIDGEGAYGTQGTNGVTQIYNLLVGPRFYPFGHRKLTTFAHALVGEGYYRNSIPPNAGFPNNVESTFAPSWEVGAGFEIPYKKHWDIRLLELDAGQTRFSVPGTLTSTQTGYRASVGLTYRLGSK